MDREKLRCSHCGSDALVGEVCFGIFDRAVNIGCIECGSIYAAPLNMKLSTDFSRSFVRQNDAPERYDEKKMKVSYKDTAHGESVTYISKQENGLVKHSIFIEEPMAELF